MSENEKLPCDGFTDGLAERVDAWSSWLEYIEACVVASLDDVIGHDGAKAILVSRLRSLADRIESGRLDADEPGNGDAPECAPGGEPEGG